jgi:hypothetical protein
LPVWPHNLILFRFHLRKLPLIPATSINQPSPASETMVRRNGNYFSSVNGEGNAKKGDAAWTAIKGI